MATYEFAAEVIVTLSIQGQDRSDMPERCIRLDRVQNTSSLGRASKVHAKGFVAAADNGWFNSPVMSRAHAEVVADLDKQVVWIRDTGSLHGTFVNEELLRLPPNHLREIHDGDEIAFGVAILRNGDSYKPTKVRVGIEFNNGGAQHARCSTFAVPEGSDIEEDYSSDDGKQGDKEVTKPAEMAKLLNRLNRLVGTTPTTSLRPIQDNVVDLTDHNVSGRGETRNGIDDKTRSNVIDLTSPRSTSTAPNAGGRSDQLDTNMLGTWSEQEENLTDNDSQSDRPDLSSPNPDQEVAEISDSDMSSIDDVREHSGLEDYETDLDDEFDDEPDLEAEYSSDNDIMVDPDDPETVIWDDLPVKAVTAKETEENPAEDDLVERALTENAPAEETPAKENTAEEVPADETAALSPKGDSGPSPAVDREYATTDDNTAGVSLPVEAESEPHADYSAAAARPTIPSILNPVVSPDSPADSVMLNYRQPRSVDAGTHGSELPASIKARESPMYHQPVAMFPLLAAGDEFLNTPDPFSLDRVQPIPEWPASQQETSAYNFQQMKLVQGDLQGGLSWNRKHRTHVGIADIVDSCPQQSDGAAATDNNDQNLDSPAELFKTIHKKNMAALEAQRRLKRKAEYISDLSSAEREWNGIVEAVEAEAGSKRKADNISGVSNAEISFDSASSAKPITDNSREAPAESPVATMSGTPDGAVPWFPAQPRQPPRKVMLRRPPPGSTPNHMQPERLDEVRPPKRMRLRHIAEKIGYAALGGATVGAAIVTTLIYTAPSFA